MKFDYMIIYGCHKKRILDKRLNHALNITKENNNNINININFLYEIVK